MKFSFRMPLVILATVFAITSSYSQEINPHLPDAPTLHWTANTVGPVLTTEQVGDLWVLNYKGPITAKTPELVNKELLKKPKISIINLKSDGGLLKGGIELAYIIREKKLQAIVEPGNACVSSCAFALLGSPNPVISGLVAFHRPYIPNSPQTEKYTDQLGAHNHLLGVRLAAFMVDMKYRPSFLLELLSLTSRSTFIVYDRAKDLQKWKIAEDISATDAFEMHDLPMKKSIYERIVNYHRIQFILKRQLEK